LKKDEMGKACCRHRRNALRGLVGKPKRKRALEDLHVGGRIILKWILEK
jgi:hypothetical protein